MRENHHVYVVELHSNVLDEPKFKKANPDYIHGKPCVYVGMTQTRVLTSTKLASKPTSLPTNTGFA
jgi:hypothetical protein